MTRPDHSVAIAEIQRICKEELHSSLNVVLAIENMLARYALLFDPPIPYPPPTPVPPPAPCTVP